MLNELLNTEIEGFAHIGQILNIKELPNFASTRPNLVEIKEVVKSLINIESDLELVQKIAIKFGNDYDLMFDCEDKLVELMGEDEAFDWIDENEID